MALVLLLLLELPLLGFDDFVFGLFGILEIELSAGDSIINFWFGQWQCDIQPFQFNNGTFMLEIQQYPFKAVLFWQLIWQSAFLGEWTFEDNSTICLAFWKIRIYQYNSSLFDDWIQFNPIWQFNNLLHWFDLQTNRI